MILVDEISFLFIGGFIFGYFLDLDDRVGQWIPWSGVIDYSTRSIVGETRFQKLGVCSVSLTALLADTLLEDTKGVENFILV